ncbi:MAG TPA: sigma-70 family RNA polymerase sigma factor [Clostridiaceae bacterium]|nr:sigma-70 family RNA polymerase sigma factor [Clostridiaceae bacterium]
MERTIDKIQNYIVNNELEMEKIIKNYNNYISTIIHNSHSTFSKEDEEEIIMDVYLTLWNNKQKLDINKSMSAYIAGITKRVILKKCRNNKQIENLEDYSNQLVGEKNIELNYFESQQNQSILNEIERMKEIDREIFVSYYYEERKIKEIAIIFDMSESKVKSKLFRIRKKLNRILKKGGYDYNE